MKRKKQAIVALTLAAMIVTVGGVMAWLQSAAGPVTNTFDPSTVEVDIDETTGEDYTVLPGTTEEKDPKITAETDTDAYVYAVVTDKTQGLVDYEIADGWTKVEGLTEKITAKDKDGKDVTIDPTADGVTVYYREANGTDDNNKFGPWSVLKDDQVSYDSSLTNEDMEDAEEPIQLIFNAYAVQKEPFNDPAKAWNQDYVAVTGVTLDKTELILSSEATDPAALVATVVPEDATNKEVTWKSSDETVATVDAEGKVTPVAAGTATITVTTKDGLKSAACEVTVVVPTYGYAVQLHSATADEVTFWPAMGEKALGAVTKGVECEGDGPCIHRDSFDEIKTNLAEDSTCYDACIANGCTKKVLLDEDAFAKTADSATATVALIKTTGDGGGMVHDGLTGSERKWDDTTDETLEYPSYKGTLEKIKVNSDIPSTATMFLLSKSELEASKKEYKSRVIYRNDGVAYSWWLATESGWNSGYQVAWNTGGGGSNRPDWVYYTKFGIAPGFIY